MLSGPGRLAVCLLLGWVLFAGCQPVVPTPAPMPSYRCTPEAGGVEFDCTPHEYDDMIAKDKLYAEAEAVYRKFFAENSRIYRAGGASEASEVLLTTTAGDYLSDSLSQYRAMRNSGQKVVGGEIRLVWLKRAPGQAMKGSVVSLEACVDMSSTEVVDADGKSGPGIVGIEQAFLGRFDSELKIQNSAWEELESC